MATTTIRLDEDEERTLDELAASHGGRSNALRAGLKLLAAETHRRAVLTELLADWAEEHGDVSDVEVAEVSERYRLGT